MFCLITSIISMLFVIANQVIIYKAEKKHLGATIGLMVLASIVIIVCVAILIIRIQQ